MLEASSFDDASGADIARNAVFFHFHFKQFNWSSQFKAKVFIEIEKRLKIQSLTLNVFS